MCVELVVGKNVLAKRDGLKAFVILLHEKTAAEVVANFRQQLILIAMSS